MQTKTCNELFKIPIIPFVDVERCVSNSADGTTNYADIACSKCTAHWIIVVDGMVLIKSLDAVSDRQVVPGVRYPPQLLCEGATCIILQKVVSVICIIISTEQSSVECACFFLTNFLCNSFMILFE